MMKMTTKDFFDRIKKLLPEKFNIYLRENYTEDDISTQLVFLLVEKIIDDFSIDEDDKNLLLSNIICDNEQIRIDMPNHEIQMLSWAWFQAYVESNNKLKKIFS